MVVEVGNKFVPPNACRLTSLVKPTTLNINQNPAPTTDDAGMQPDNLQEVLLHETAVSWIRRREALNRMPNPWEETPEQFATRLKGIVKEINETLNVEGLCRAFKQRVQKLVVRDGDRISH